MSKKYVVLDLFCGCGGLSKGFINAGFKVDLGVDFDDMALKTFAYNHEGATAMKLDLFNLDNVNKIKEYFDKAKTSVDVLVGGPPCQGFSLAGPRLIDDSRNKLYRAMVKTATIIKPKVVVLENVPGMVQLHNGLVADKIISDFTELGYNMTYKILYAPDYGIPQIRKRVVFVGLLNSETTFEYPKPTFTPEEYITCEQAISDLPPLVDILGEEKQTYPCPPLSAYQKERRCGSDSIYNHIGTIHDAKTKKFIAMVPEGKNYKALPPEYSGIYKYHEALTRYHSKKPSPTINTGHRSHFHYKWNRIPTVRESARLQSFDDSFVFFGNKTQQYRQVGNAVPPLLGKAIASEIIKWLKQKQIRKLK
ncbi:MAG: DNA cytosine methyltransferase [Paludibacteraceae bacterium]|nr:DNA cytosine methyltransferase [Paludibacteraceae bacterium]